MKPLEGTIIVTNRGERISWIGQEINTWKGTAFRNIRLL